MSESRGGGATGLSYSFGDHVAVDHVDLEIRPGETFGLLERDQHEPVAGPGRAGRRDRGRHHRVLYYYPG